MPLPVIWETRAPWIASWRYGAWPKDHQFTFICRDLSELGGYARVENSAYRILKRNTPGSFTFVFPATKGSTTQAFHPKNKTIGLRVPEHAAAMGLLGAMGEPLLVDHLEAAGFPRGRSNAA